MATEHHPDERADDPYLQVLVGIASELRGIRLALEEPAGDDDPPDFTCTHCGQAFHTERQARQHAVDEHNAPAAHWRDAF